jgi:hypothetical protein
MGVKSSKILVKTSKYIKMFLLVLDILVLNFSFALSVFIIFKRFTFTEDDNFLSNYIICKFDLDSFDRCI